MPAYYIVFALAISAVTAVTEKTMVNGYLLTRLNPAQTSGTPQAEYPEHHKVGQS